MSKRKLKISISAIKVEHANKYKFALAACLIVASLAASLAPSNRFVEQTHAQENSFRRDATGATKLGLLLRRLQTTASALHTGAHPDDEDSALIATLARGQGARVAYLSLTRGEGGQNRIGSELYETLGVIRTEELLQARAIDGGDQFFTRAYDFGFTKTIDEAAEKWGERRVLADMVRTIRTYRPLVIVSRFSGTTADGHGQHQLSGHLTSLAFRLAANPAEFPEQIKEGLTAWQTRKLYASVFRRASDANNSTNNATNNNPMLRINTGRYDPLLGRSYYELAAMGRSQHKSQEMGTLELRGEQTTELRLLESTVNAKPDEQSVFDGLDVSVKGIARLADLRDSSVKNALAEIDRNARLALEKFSALEPQTIAPALVAGLTHTRAAREMLRRSSDAPDAKREADFLLQQKEREFSEALQLALGLRIDVLADREKIVPGESFNLTMRAFVSDASLASVKNLNLRLPENWKAERIAELPASANENTFARHETAQASARFRVTAPANAQLTEPYWLSEPREEDFFRWSDRAAQGAPFTPPIITGEAVIAAAGGVQFKVEQKGEYRYADAVSGEVRREVAVVPALSIESTPALVVVPNSKQSSTERIIVRLKNNSQSALAGRVQLELPANWKTQRSQATFDLKARDGSAAFIFDVNIPAQQANDLYKIRATAATIDGRKFDKAEHTIKYSHINAHRIYSRAETTVRVFDFKVAPVRVGYIMGSGDEVPEAIRRMKIDVTLLNEDDLSISDLQSRFDCIVVGVRASQVRPDFVANNNRLLDFARAGGTLVVLYQRTDYTERNLALFPAQIGQATRTTDENAPVTILQPAHPVFHFPNVITNEDWRGWVQERSLYNFTTFDSRYVTLLESHDKGEPQQTGGTVYARIGAGHYIYTSYSWFRQLPAGVPGAFRLFANMISLSKAPPKFLRAREAGAQGSFLETTSEQKDYFRRKLLN